jgi:hypothetical protein
LICSFLILPPWHDASHRGTMPLELIFFNPPPLCILFLTTASSSSNLMTYFASVQNRSSNKVNK